MFITDELLLQALRAEATAGLQKWETVESEAVADQCRAEMALAGQVALADGAEAQLRLLGKQQQ
jgi:hypothetical protein